MQCTTPVLFQKLSARVGHLTCTEPNTTMLTDSYDTFKKLQVHLPVHALPFLCASQLAIIHWSTWSRTKPVSTRYSQSSAKLQHNSSAVALAMLVRPVHSLHSNGLDSNHTSASYLSRGGHRNAIVLHDLNLFVSFLPFFYHWANSLSRGLWPCSRSEIRRGRTYGT